jgi:NADH-quinone oxidoreductase subunit G
VVIDPRPVSLPCAHLHIPSPQAAIADVFGRFLRAGAPAAGLGGEAARFHAALPPERGEAPETVRSAAQRLSAARRPVIVCGTELAAPGLVDLAADAALLLRAAQKPAGLFYVLPGANAAAAAMLTDAGESVRGVLQAAVDGAVKALVVVESDPLGSFSDRALAEAAFARLELLVVVDYLDSATSRRARILLPSQTIYEAGGVFINQEGRAQETPRIYDGGASIQETGAGSHPPRVFGLRLPGSDPRPAWRVLAGLAGEAPDAAPVETRSERLRRDLAQASHPALREMPRIPEDGVRLSLGTSGAPRFAAPPVPPASVPDELEVVVTERTFGTEELSAYSTCLESLQERPFVALHPRDADAWGLGDGDRVALRAPSGTVELDVRCVEGMAPGVAVLPRLRSTALPATGSRLRRHDLRKG